MLRLILTDGNGVQGLTATFGAFINTSISDAAASAAAAANSANAAAASATNASNSATAAATSASQAASSATGAATSATNASNSATAASGSASAASTSATNAANSASAAASSASSASTSATNAANSATSAATSASNAAATLANALTKANNLSDVSSASTARTNLGLGTAATQNTGTSGAVLPFLNGGNTWSAQQVFTTGGISGNDVTPVISAAPGKWRYIDYATNGTLRWAEGVSATAESGSNAGSDWFLNRYDDTGAYLGQAVYVSRATGAMIFGGSVAMSSNQITGVADPTSAQDAATKNYVDAQNLLYAARQPDLIINPHGSIQQETTTPVSLTAAAVYYADQWLGNAAGSSFVYQSGVTTGTVSNFDPCHHYAKTTTAKASLAAGDVATLGTRIEGRYLRRLLYGSALAKGSWVRFRASATANAVASMAIRNAATNRSFVSTFNLTTTPTDFAIFVPGDTTGTWLTDNSMAADLLFTFAAGSTWQTSTLNAWQTGNFVAATTQSNQLDTVNRQMNITDVSWRESAILLPFTPIDYELELLRCQRYFWSRTYAAGGEYFAAGMCYSTSSAAFTCKLPVTMRTIPVLDIGGDVTTLQGIASNGAAAPVNGVLASGIGTPDCAVFQLSFTGTPFIAGGGTLVSVASSGKTVKFTARM